MKGSGSGALIRDLLDHHVWVELSARHGEPAVARLRKTLEAKLDRQAAPPRKKKSGGQGAGGGTVPRGNAGKVMLYCDGGSRGNPGPAGGGGEILDEEGGQLLSFSVYFGRATNNVAEYRALIEGIDRVRQLGARFVEIRLDSELLVKQIRGEYKVKSPHLAPLHGEVMEKLRGLAYSIRHVPREENRVADALAGEAIENRT